MRTLTKTVIFFTLTLMPLQAGKYFVEQLFEVPYKVCPVAPLPEEAKEKGVKVVYTEMAKKLFDEGAYFYDARRTPHFEEGHIPGARLVKFDVTKARYTVLHLPESKATPMVFYCYGETCANSYEAALAVREYGYKNVYWYSPGYSAWKEAGYPTEQSEK